MDKYIDGLKTTFNQTIYQKFLQAVEEFGLISAGDTVAVCISGGKDSILLAKCMQLYKESKKVDFNIINLVMDPGYKKENKNLILSNLQELQIDAQIFDTEIFDVVDTMEQSPCYICARMRRGALYNGAQIRGANKIALGHHFDDVVETVLMGVIYNGQVQSMLPKLKSKNFKDMQLIRPFYYVKEQDILSWRDYYGLNFLLCACKFTENINLHKKDSKRQEIKELLAKLSKTYPNVQDKIFDAAYCIDLQNIAAYKKQ